ncbi:MAG TPA: porin [Steroidobacteraceae bacterium]|nr:porin [Steroidobacteraceae bacterium]
MHHSPRTPILSRLAPALLLLGVLIASGTAGAAAPPDADARLSALQQTLEQMQAALKQLSEENRALREHQEEVDRKLAQLGAAAVAQATPAAPAPSASVLPNASALPQASTAPPAGATPAGAGMPSSLSPGLRLWGYGEVYFTDPVHDRNQAQADLARAVFGIGYAFDERTEFNSEFEVEHAVASADDVGEFEVEQFYVDHRLNDAVGVRAGLFLMPFGLLNEHHEPTNFYGMQRNFVETLIIPSTWREGGISLLGSTTSGFGWNVGLTTGTNLSKWEFSPEVPPYSNALLLEDSGIAPLQATHQELSLANSRNLSQYLSLGYYGVPGLTLGAAISTGNAVPVPAAANAPPTGNQRVTLWETHARWAPARWDLSALYARGTISNTASSNAANPGSPNPIPASFYGYYLQAAYLAWQRQNYRLYPFVRYEYYNMGSSYDGTSGPVIPVGLVPLSPTPGDYGLWPQNHDRVWTTGVNFYLNPHVVIKGDYQWFDVNTNFNRFDLGLGVSF